MTKALGLRLPEVQALVRADPYPAERILGQRSHVVAAQRIDATAVVAKARDAIGGDIKHVWTSPYRPQTNGKVERFNRTLASEWAYAATYLSDQDRAAQYPAWLHHYNHHRPHTGIGGKSPIERVHNVPGKNS